MKAQRRDSVKWMKQATAGMALWLTDPLTYKRDTCEYRKLNKSSSESLGRAEVLQRGEKCSSEIRAKSEHASAEQCFTMKRS